MTGYDFSPTALAEARKLNDELGAGVEFVEGELYDAVAVLGEEQFDLVFTGIGALCWLPDIRRWASVVAGLLRPGGRLFIREGHPMLWALADSRADGLLVVDYPYFETTEALVWDEEGTYVETEAEFLHTVTHVWNHGIGEIVTAVLDNGMVITMLEEHGSIPWEALPGQMSIVAGSNHEWQLTDRPERLPHSYTLQAVKR
jgi:SAM-dependent methyltransferase